VGPDVALSAARFLAGYAAAGGAVLVLDELDAERITRDLAPLLRDAGPVRERLVGGGIVLSPAPEAPRVTLAERLASRLGGPAVSREALREAASHIPAPSPSPALGARVGLASLAFAHAHSFLLAALTRSSRASTVLATSAFSVLFALAFRLGGLAPASPVYRRSLEVLEAPEGSLVARRLELSRIAAPRVETTDVVLPAGPPPWPLAARGPVSVLLEGDAPLVHPRIRITASAEPRAFVRLGSTLLDGPVRVAREGPRVTVTNAAHPGSNRRLSRAIVVTRDGVHPLGDVAARTSSHVDLSRRPLDFLEYRRRVLDPTPEGRSVGGVLGAILSGRSLGPALLVVAEVSGTDEPRAREGLAEPATSFARILVVEGS
jgi:hypothetical protein